MNAPNEQSPRFAAPVTSSVIRRLALDLVAAYWLIAFSGSPASSQAWQLVYEADFANTQSLDPQVWRFEEGFVRNKEAQYYVAPPDPAISLKNGHLVIEARREHARNARFDPNSRKWWLNRESGDYVSGSMVSRKSWTCARFEIVARLPTGQGSFPAIWLTNDREGYGEIDIVEAIGREPTKLYSTIHIGPNVENLQKVGTVLPCDECTTRFRKYAAEIFNGRARITVDDNVVLQQDIGSAGQYGKVLQEGFYLRINLALGSAWSGPVDPNVLPLEMLVASIRIFQHKRGAELVCND